MSRSPTSTSAKQTEDAYLAAWQALGERIRTGGSFSGRERNCCFLNTGGPRFSDVSSVVGLDQIDDSRAVALGDWDHDGDLDVWLTNRTGPRVRFLRNELPAINDFVAVKLVGDPTRQCNRDAIGARVELYLESGERAFERKQRPHQIQTLCAGDGFLSQSSKWLHFGIRKGAKIERLVVRWPNGQDVESFKGLTRNGRYRLVQTTGQAVAVNTRHSPVFLAAGTVEVPPTTDHARLRLSSPIPITSLHYQDLEGHEVHLSAPYERPLLLTLWASWCQPCREDLRELAQAKDKLQQVGLQILALNVEGLDSNSSLSPDDAKQLLSGLGFGYSSGFADTTLVERLDTSLSQAYYGHRQIPLPASFLIDKQGGLTLAYMGPLDVMRLPSDVATLGLNRLESLRLSVPFKGRWAADVIAVTPNRMANFYLEEGSPEEARDHLLDYLQRNPPPDASSVDQQARHAFAEVYHLLGRISMMEKQTDQAAGYFHQALHLNPTFQPSLVDFGILQTARGNYAKATRHLEMALKQQTDNPKIHTKLGEAKMHQGQVAAAIKHFKKALEVSPNWHAATNNLAWLMATHPDTQFRNGPEAVRLAKRLVETVGSSRPDALDTLAAAYAEAGKFDEAVRTADRCVELVKSLGNEQLLTRFEQRLKLYRSGQPFRQKETPKN